jgi:hypothetical protein
MQQFIAEMTAQDQNRPYSRTIQSAHDRSLGRFVHRVVQAAKRTTWPSPAPGERRRQRQVVGAERLADSYLADGQR